jgi:hypothetical protein
LAANSNAIAAREVAFKPISKLITRVFNTLKASDTTQEVDDQVHSLVRKIQGVRATPKKNSTGIRRKSSKRNFQSTDELRQPDQNIDKLVKLLGSNEPYAPNEDELKVEILQNICNQLIELNAQVMNASTQLSNARIARNEILYKLDVGLTDTALAVKNYIKAVFGAPSPQYKQVVSSLKFTNPR